MSFIKNRPSNRSGFTLIEIMIIVGIIGLLAVIALPNYLKARASSQKSACLNNIRQLDSAKHEWATETSSLPTAVPTPAQITPYIGRGAGGGGSLNNLFCPQDSNRSLATSYNINDVSTTPSCIIAPLVHLLP